MHIDPSFARAPRGALRPLAHASERFDNERSSAMPGPAERGRLTLPWSLLLLGSGYFLLVAGPLLTSRFAALRWVRDLASGRAWVPAPAAAGTALLGAAALIYVVARLVRDVEQRPYASIAPVLAVFSGFVLTSTRTDLPLPGVGAAQLGVLVLALALLGGVLIGRESLGERALGWLLTVLPSLAVLAAVTATLGHADPVTMLRGVDPAMRMYLMLLSVSSLCLGLVGAVARNLVQRVVGPAADMFASGSRAADGFGEPALRLPRPHSVGAPEHAPRRPALQPGFGVQPVSARAPELRQQRTPTLLGAPGRSQAQPMGVRTLPLHRVGPTSYAQPAMYDYGQQTPVHGELSLDDPDLLLLTRGKLPVSRILTVLLVLAAAGLAAAYVFVVRPRQHDADLARVRSAALHPSSAPTGEAAEEQSAESLELRTIMERAAEGQSAVQAASGAPTVTSLTPTAQPVDPAPAVTPLEVLPEQALAARVVEAVESVEAAPERAHRSHRAHSRHLSARGPEPKEEAEQVAPVQKLAPIQKATSRAQTAAPVAKTAPVAASARPVSGEPDLDAALNKVAPGKASAKPSRNESDLDLDSLLNGAVKGSTGVQAQEDPILGL